MAESNAFSSWREISKNQSSDDSDDGTDIRKHSSKKPRKKRSRSGGKHSKDQQPKASSKDVERTFDHPVFKEISKENGDINKMDISDLSRRLGECGLSNRGNYHVKQKRLKNWTRNKKLKEANVEIPGKYNIDYYVVIDFEATCEKDNPPGFIQEIIEFPAVLLDVKKKSMVSEFHSYCRPVENPHLTDFCTELTGITQAMVDSAPLFPTVFRRFGEWLDAELQTTDLFAVLTDGPWDVSRFLKEQCKLCEIEPPHYFKTWVNIRKHFGNYYKVQRANLSEMLSNLGMEFEGRPHSGIDDARNIARIANQLLKDGCELKINDSL